MTLPAVTAEVAATILGRLAGRIRKRSEALLADQASWIIDAATVTIGTATVTFRSPDATLTSEDGLACDCLLAPNCAHLAAVVAACPLAEPDSAPTESDSAPAESDSVPAESDTTVQPTPTPPTEPALSVRQVEALTEVWQLGAHILTTGAARRDTRTYAAALSALHKLRAAGLMRADRAFTGVVTALNRAVGDPQSLSRAEFTDALAESLLIAHMLLRTPAPGVPIDADYIGTARRRYSQIGAITAVPLAIEPVLTTSGYAGAVLTVRDGQGRLWTLQDVRPGAETQVWQSYHAGIEIGELMTSMSDLTHRKLILGQATGSADGRLGRGRSVRAALGSPVTYPEVWDDVPRWPADMSGWAIVTGTITGGDEAGLVVAGPTGEVAITVPAIARALGWGETAWWLASGRDIEVVCLVRRRGSDLDLVGLHRVGLDPEFAHDAHNVTWCGLDHLAARDIGAPRDATPVVAPTQAEIETFSATAPDVAVLVTRWLHRAAAGGLGAVRAAERELPADKRTLTVLGASFAAELLTELVAATRAGTRAFDGTWVPDPEPLARAWLALSRYLR